MKKPKSKGEHVKTEFVPVDEFPLDMTGQFVPFIVIDTHQSRMTPTTVELMMAVVFPPFATRNIRLTMIEAAMNALNGAKAAEDTEPATPKTRTEIQ